MSCTHTTHPDAVCVDGLVDPDLAAELCRRGHATIPSFLTAEQCELLQREFHDAMDDHGEVVGDEWFPTGRLGNRALRDRIGARVGSVVFPRLEHLVDPAVLEPLRIDYSVKPAGPRSALGPHQDYSIVDERRFRSLYMWIPLVDTDGENGTLHVLEGSHHFSNRVRSYHVPARFDPVIDEVEQMSRRLDRQAGDLVLMTSGVVHFSPPNRSSELRLAVHGLLKPIAAPLLYFFADDATPEGQVEMFEVGIDDYLELVDRGRPGDEVRRAGTIPREPADMSPERFRDGLASALG